MLNVDSNFTSVLGLVFSTAWKVFTSFNIPGTNVNPAEVVMAALVVMLTFKLVLPLIGFHVPDKSPYSGSRINRYEGGNGGNVSSSNRGNV